MNAYELAKELKEDTCIQIGSLKPKELADVLIQMADRIAELQEVNGRFANLIQSLREEVDKLRKESE